MPPSPAPPPAREEGATGVFCGQLFDHSVIVERRIVKAEKVEGDSFLLLKMVLNLES
jgi:hypothetical protein